MKYTSYEALGRALDGLSEAEQSALQRLMRLIVTSSNNFDSENENFQLSQAEASSLVCNYWNCSEKARWLYDFFLKKYNNVTDFIHQKVKELRCFFKTLERSNNAISAIVTLRAFFEANGSLFKSFGYLGVTNDAYPRFILHFESLRGEIIYVYYAHWFSISMILDAFKLDFKRRPSKNGIFKILYNDDAPGINYNSFVVEYYPFDLNCAAKIPEIREEYKAEFPNVWYSIPVAKLRDILESKNQPSVKIGPSILVG